MSFNTNAPEYVVTAATILVVETVIAVVVIVTINAAKMTKDSLNSKLWYPQVMTSPPQISDFLV